jgi:hypothetical protein
MRCMCVTFALLVSGCATTAQPESTGSFSFAVLGDTAYNQPEDEALYAAMIGTINAHRPAFTIHVGDTKGAGPCDDDFQNRILAGFARFDAPLMYTPGDNEWTDCHKPVNGGANPLERLAAIRRIFFADDSSFGKRRIPLEVQSGEFPENRRWTYGNVVFATLHIVGSQNGIADAAEHRARTDADISWLRQTFSAAKAQSARAVVIAFQAELFSNPGEIDGFSETRDALRSETLAAGVPVLLVHGDGHRFMIDRPFYVSTSDGATYSGASVYRLQTFGAPELGAVEVRVAPGLASPFSFSPIYGAQNSHLRNRS